MRFFVRKTSLDHFWNGFVAATYDTSGGLSETPWFAEHVVSMHVGAPVRTTGRCDGSVSHRLQSPGDIDIVPAGYSGAWEDEGPTTMLGVHLSPWFVRTASEEMGVNPDRVAIMPQLQIKDPQIEHIGWALKAELETDEPSGRLYADGLGLALAAHLLRRYAPEVSRRITTGLPKRRLKNVMDYIHEHLADDLSLAQIAQIANLSSGHFKMLFKQSVGMPVHQYVIRRRVEYAIQLLLGDELSLTDVALEAGFANPSHMARCMRRLTGMTPGALRKAV